MFLEIDLETFHAVQDGFLARRLGHRTIYTSSGLGHLERIEGLAESEYGQAVELDRERRTISFGRDFLGQYPLSYACAKGRLYISDSLPRIGHALAGDGVRLTPSEEALALYFSMGYVPHGLSSYREIVNCRAAGFYTWSAGSVRFTRQFEPVEIDEKASVNDLGEAIEREISSLAAQAPAIDVWCSGGLDSSIMAVRFNSDGRRADLLTLAYGREIHERFGDGERRFAGDVARACGARLRDVELTCRKFEEMHETFVRSHNGPVIDTPLPPKYALAEASRSLAVTGEGGDNFFGGVKNTRMVYGHHRDPSIPLGWLYALAHERFAGSLKWIFRNGDALTEYVRSYCEGIVSSYPGPLVRKLFYLNALEKLSGLIFAESYFPGRLYGVKVRHPLAALSVYRQAFRLPDRRKFLYPENKIALKELYGAQVPQSVLKRRKAGTQLPRLHYLQSLSPDKFDFSALSETGFFSESFLADMLKPEMQPRWPLLLYGLVTANLWFSQRADVARVAAGPGRPGGPAGAWHANSSGELNNSRAARIHSGGGA